MTRRIPPHLTATSGIESILLLPDEELVTDLQKKAKEQGKEWTPPDQNESGKMSYDPSIMILDTFFSDESDKSILTDICHNTEAFPSIHILLVNPNSDFAKRQPSIRRHGLLPDQKLSMGLTNIVDALGGDKISTNKNSEEDYQSFVNRLIEYIKTIGESRSLQLKFYSIYPRSPMYFFNDILVSGHFGIEKDCLELPWYKIIDDPVCQYDLFDEYRREFEYIWQCESEFELSSEINTSIILSTNKNDLKVNIVIICALEKELNAVLTMNGFKQEEWNRLETENNRTFFYKKDIKTNSNKVLSVIACRRADEKMGSAVSASLTTEIILRFKPELILLVGIAAGAKSKGRNIGDVLIGTKVVDYESAKVTEKDGQQQIEYDSNSISITKEIDNLFLDTKKYDTPLSKIYDNASIKYDLAERSFNIYSGTLVCGNKVIASQKFVDDIKSRHRKFIGLEMESYGVYYSAENSSEDNPHFLCIKSVCDFADIEKNDSGQKIAAFTAAEFCYEFIVNHIDGII